MFPAYFRLSAVSLAFNVAVLAVFQPVVSSTVWEKVQLVALGLALLFTLINLLVMEPITTKVPKPLHPPSTKTFVLHYVREMYLANSEVL